jgi:2-keto-4-pentenoate hydratase/2-oxohepta-3-ene-1,7-dioic acid hydratase in catechol pathway
MRLATLRTGATTRPALLHADRAYLIHDLGAAASRTPALPSSGDGGAILATSAGVDALRALADALAITVERGDVEGHALTELGPPLARPGKIICVGRNYAEHARELGNELPERPILFAKFATAIVGPFDDIVRPSEVTDLDYEAELCVVIGRGGRRIPKEQALDHVGGYCCANDVSARTAQLALGDQWLRGKSFDTFCPLGPAIVTRDEIDDPQNLRITCRVDGETRQDANTGDMIFDVATLVSYCSDVFTLEPGDLILTGTPAGVALGRDPAPWLQPGQLCEVEVEGIGRIANRIVQEGETTDD